MTPATFVARRDSAKSALLLSRSGGRCALSPRGRFTKEVKRVTCSNQERQR